MGGWKTTRICRAAAVPAWVVEAGSPLWPMGGWGQRPARPSALVAHALSMAACLPPRPAALRCARITAVHPHLCGTPYLIYLPA